MARQLWLLRHADAEPHGTRPDAERQLTDRGKGQSFSAGVAIAAAEVEFAAILASPKARARETAELALEQLGEREQALLELHPLLAGGVRAREALELLAGVDGDGPVLIVAHEPDLSGIVGELTGGRVDLKKGGLAVVRLSAGGAELILLLRPAELSLIAEIASAGL
ncbi:MAG TPA: histidine phosphatase family protein [Solirubrobacteraceae bacterium]|nr:histidine phosphatase family protein [Solirubrobacteraceae bacterium]